MSAKHALLGLLLDREAYPYQLADRMQRRLGPGWEVNSGQLYQTVKALQRDGLIERVRRGNAERRERHVFAITQQGVREFERWFEEAPDPVRLPRRPLLLKITFAGPERLAEALAKVQDYERECARRLREIAAMRDELGAGTLEGTTHGEGRLEGHERAGGPLVRADELLLRLNLSTDVFGLEGELRWAAHARELLQWLQDSDAQWPARRERAAAGSGERAATGSGERAAAGAGEPKPEAPSDDARRRLFERMASSSPSSSPSSKDEGEPPRSGP